MRATIAGVSTVALQTLRTGAPRRGWSRASEASLVRAAQRGSSEAFAELFRRHWPRAHRAAWLVVHDATAAEDVAQEAFLAAVRALDRFDRRRPFGPWLHRIVVNRAIDYARARELRREVADAGIEPAVFDRADAPGRRRRSRRWPRSRPTSARSSSCATCSASRRARSPRRSGCRAGRSTRGCGAGSTGCRRR